LLQAHFEQSLARTAALTNENVEAFGLCFKWRDITPMWKHAQLKGSPRVSTRE
jgi:hypothetical protein